MQPVFDSKNVQSKYKTSLSVQKEKRETSQVCKKRSISQNSCEINPINDLKRSIDAQENGGDDELKLQDSDEEQSLEHNEAEKKVDNSIIDGETDA